MLKRQQPGDGPPPARRSPEQCRSTAWRSRNWGGSNARCLCLTGWRARNCAGAALVYDDNRIRSLAFRLRNMAGEAEDEEEDWFRPVWETEDELDPPGFPRVRRQAAEPDYRHPCSPPSPAPRRRNSGSGPGKGRRKAREARATAKPPPLPAPGSPALCRRRQGRQKTGVEGG